MNQTIIEIAHTVSAIPGVKRLLKPFYYPLKRVSSKRQNKRFIKNSLLVLEAFDKCMCSNGINYTLVFGSLLGAIREGGFIKHDMDIDVSVPVEDRKKSCESLLSAGFKMVRRYRIDDGELGCEETFVYKNTQVTIDVFYVCPPIDKLPYCCCWNLCGNSATARESMKKHGKVIPRRIELPFSYETKRIVFESIEVNIDINADQISRYCYGPDYMIPNPNYIVPVEHRVVWSEKSAIYEEF